jgi:hypothetical protein
MHVKYKDVSALKWNESVIKRILHGIMNKQWYSVVGNTYSLQGPNSLELSQCNNLLICHARETIHLAIQHHRPTISRSIVSLHLH